MPIIALVILALLWVIIFALNKGFRDETGVAPPSSSAYRGIKRRARKKGVSTEAALNKWVDNKQRRK